MRAQKNESYGIVPILLNNRQYVSQQGNQQSNILSNPGNLTLDKTQHEEKSYFKFINKAVVAEESRELAKRHMQESFVNPLKSTRETQKFIFKPEYIIMLCDHAEDIIKKQPMVLKLKAPIKIFGDIHGQYSDLMRYFDLWGQPWCNGKDGDIESFDYIFLGNFIDRGSHSLETICVLLALKISYPEQIHLIRGNHEDKWINKCFGFSDECAQRLGEEPDEEDSIFSKFNKLFEYLPLAAIIEDKIICLHGGIGAQLNYVEEIENIQRPLQVLHEVSNPQQRIVNDILWSDPTESDQELGIQPNLFRDPVGTGNIVKFGPDRVQNFLQKNNLDLIIRSHECVMDGFERFAGGKLITIYSAPDQCGKHKNAGAVLILKQNLELVAKLIYPQNLNAYNWIQDEEALKRRPPTPPIWKNQVQSKSYKTDTLQLIHYCQ